MAVLGARRKWIARAWRACAWTGVALLLSCGGGSTSPPGTPVITLGDTSGDFAAYQVVIDSITLTDTNGSIVQPLLTTESVDLAKLTDLSELLEVPAVPSATYKSASITFDYAAAAIYVYVNGQATPATVVDSTGAAVGTEVVNITFDPNHQYVIENAQSTRLAINFDLAASNSIDTSGSKPKVTVRPFVVATPAPLDSTPIRARGLFVTVPNNQSQFIMNVRPLIDLTSALGAINVDVDSHTYYNIEGVAYTGAPGLTALGALPESTIIAAFGSLTSFTGITPTMHANAVYAGTSLEGPLQDEVSGIVSEHVGSVLNVHGATYVSRLGATAFYNNVTVKTGSKTIVSQDGVNATGLAPDLVSIGQQVAISGQATLSATTGNIELDATAGQVRMGSTRLWGTVNSASASSLNLDLLTLDNYSPSVFKFTGTGVSGQDANPAAYLVNTGTINAGTSAANSLLQVDGFVTAFGHAPPDFAATAVTAGASTEQRLIMEWTNGGSLHPFTSIHTTGLVVNLNDADLGTVHEIRTGPATLDLKTLPAMPLITAAGANASQLQFAVGNNTLTAGVSVFNTFDGFVPGLNSAFNGANKIFRLVAVGQFNSASNTFVATRISVSLQE